MTIYHTLKDYQEVMTRGDYLVFDTPLTCRFIGRFSALKIKSPAGRIGNVKVFSVD